MGDQESYERQVARLAAWYRSTGVPGVVNLYADPSQVVDWPGFFDAVALLAPFAVPSYGHLLEAAAPR